MMQAAVPSAVVAAPIGCGGYAWSMLSVLVQVDLCERERSGQHESNEWTP
jgi:hypothetical protein